MRSTGVWQEKSPIALERLRQVTLLHYDFEGQTLEGSMVVMDAVAPQVLKIFKALWERKFPLKQVMPIDFYQGSDDLSMEANNSSAFNYRPIANSSSLSLHSYGVALDLNPWQNPFVGNPFEIPDKACSGVEVWPSQGVPYLNRTRLKPGMVECVKDIFEAYGFREWGGSWESPQDYHHFQLPRPLAELLAKMTGPHAETFFNWYVKNDPRDLDYVALNKAHSSDPGAFALSHS